jgi:putative component of membrane protein insertase Oxa1/YidC/SpoIIIJ protein YidD
MRYLLLIPIKFYQLFISPLLGSNFAPCQCATLKNMGVLIGFKNSSRARQPERH